MRDRQHLVLVLLIAFGTTWSLIAPATAQTRLEQFIQVKDDEIIVAGVPTKGNGMPGPLTWADPRWLNGVRASQSLYSFYDARTVQDKIAEAIAPINSDVKKLQGSIQGEVATATTKEVNARLTDETKKVLQEDMLDKLAAQIAARLGAQFDDKLMRLEEEMKVLKVQVLKHE